MAAAVLERHGRLPVRLAYPGGYHAVPGITITRRAGQEASGYLSVSSARVFGSALARQFAADHARGNYSGSGLLSGVTISLVGASAPVLPRPADPQFPLHNLTVTATNQWGKPDNGDVVMIINADDPASFSDPRAAFNIFYRGSAKFTVPAGHYWALADFVRSINPNHFTQRAVVLPQFTVAGRVTKIHLAARSASSLITVKTPRPAQNFADNWTVVRHGRHGALSGSGIFTENGPLWISPERPKLAVGSIQSFTMAELESTGQMRVPYTYNVDFVGPRGVIPAQQFTVRPATLSTIRERVYLNPASSGSFGTGGGTAAQWLASTVVIAGTTNSGPLPGEQIEYLTANPDIIWASCFVTDNFLTGQCDDSYSLRESASTSVDWNEYPLHTVPDGLFGTPSAYRVGNELWFAPNAFSDDTPGHTGIDEATGVRYSVSQDGKKIGGGLLDDLGMAQVGVTAKPSVVTFAVTASQPPSVDKFSTATDTVWKIHTLARPQAKVPPSRHCITAAISPLPTTLHCAVLPMLTVSYHVRELGLDGFAPAGSQLIAVSVGHIDLAGTTPIVSFKARMSRDEGRTWQPVKVTRTSGGHYALSFSLSAGVDPTLSITATDAAGNSIAETITDAYGVGG